MIIISCGASKIITDKPVQAWKLYTGTYYRAMLRLASVLDSDIYILSAAYGLLHANDLIITYDWKMNTKRAQYFRQNNLIKFNGLSLLGKTYKSAVNGVLIDVIPESVGGMGYRLQYAINAAANKQQLIDFGKLQDGCLREFL